MSLIFFTHEIELIKPETIEEYSQKLKVIPPDVNRTHTNWGFYDLYFHIKDDAEGIYKIEAYVIPNNRNVFEDIILKDIQNTFGTELYLKQPDIEEIIDNE